MFLIVAFLLAGPLVTSPEGVASEWVSKPKRERLDHCARRLLPDGVAARVTLECVSAAKDRVENCKVVKSTAPGDEAVDDAAICWAKSFRIRTTNETGQVVTGATMQIPVGVYGGRTVSPALETSPHTWTPR